MKNALILKSTVGMSREEWLDCFVKTICASFYDTSREVVE